MKSTYKLYGVIYDNLPEFKEGFLFTKLNINNVLEIFEPKCLFDLDLYIRKINLSFLFSIEHQNDLDLILSIIDKVDIIIINIDVSSKNSIINDFIDLRIRQIIKLFLNKCNDVQVYMNI